ncbi:MAG: sigma-54-dependent Fis family transcriptional regulator [Deltaproteobacteria bacterium]|nr:sigma-54-dependent Fis family transcriptional regulator [Deltaproteobacteria bacterium]
MDESGRATLLVVDDDAAQRKTLAGFLRKRGYAVDEAGSATEARGVAAAAPVDLLLTDLRLGGPDGISLLADLRRAHPDLQAIVITAYGTVEDAVRAMRAGAYDFVAKPVDLVRLEALVEKALERVSLARENRSLRQAVDAGAAFADLVGDGRALRQVKDLAARVAPTRASVLILGESGTGKEVVARAIHRLSGRRDGPFVTLNCAVLSETLVESELFGHEKGAFTGAAARKPGRFELARGGTLFLDEVGDIPPGVQVKLLNVLQTGRFERVGGTEEIETDARVIAATHRDLEKRIAGGEFRADLYYRLNVVTIRMPALRERLDDVPRLVEHFLRKHADLSATGVGGASADALAALARHDFPGNVRELENLVERALVLAEGPLLEPEDFPAPAPPDGPRAATASGGGLEEQVDRLERDLIGAALARNGGNQSAAARELGVSERAIRYKIRRLGL